MPQPRYKYEEITEWTHDAVEQALVDDDSDALRIAVVAVAMHDDDWRYAQNLCIRLSSHQHFNVRGNAILGFAHIARIHSQLDQPIVKPIIEAALLDPEAYVRGHAFDAIDDTTHFLEWKYDQKN